MSRNDRTTSTHNPLRFSPIPVALLKDDQIPHGAKVLLGILLDFAWSDTSTWVSVETLASVMGYGIRTIQLWLGSLKGHGWIRFEPDPSVKTGRRIVLVWREENGRGEAGRAPPRPRTTPVPPETRTGNPLPRSARHPTQTHQIAEDADQQQQTQVRRWTGSLVPTAMLLLGIEARAGRAHAGSQATATATPSTVEKLVGSGVTRSVAQELAGEFGDDQVFWTSPRMASAPIRA